MKKSKSPLRQQLFKASAVVLGLMIAGCGGSDDRTESPAPVAVVPGTTIPVLATTNPAAAFAFVSTTVVTSSETDEPLETAEAQLATSETDEPDGPV